MKKISALRHIQSKPSERAKKALLCCQHPILYMEKKISDGKGKPQILTKGGTDIVFSWNTFTLHGRNLASLWLLHAWQLRGKWKDIWCLKHKEDISNFSSHRFGWNLTKASALTHVCRQKLHNLTSMVQLNMKIFLTIALEVPKPVPNIENRYKCTGGRKKGCKLHEDNCPSKSKNHNIPMSIEQCQSCGKSIWRAHSIKICNSCFQWYVPSTHVPSFI